MSQSESVWNLKMSISIVVRKNKTMYFSELKKQSKDLIYLFLKYINLYFSWINWDTPLCSWQSRHQGLVFPVLWTGADYYDCWPIRSKYLCHVICLDQWEPRIKVQILMMTVSQSPIIVLIKSYIIKNDFLLPKVLGTFLNCQAQVQIYSRPISGPCKLIQHWCDH